jgi:hypothetical protein
VNAVILAPKTGGGSNYTINCRVECLGDYQEKNITLKASDTNQRVMIYNGDNLSGVDKAGNKVKVTIGRVPGGGLLTTKDGLDDSPFSSVIVQSIDVVFNTQERPKTGSLSATSRLVVKDNTTGWMTGEGQKFSSRTDSATYDASGNLVYNTPGRATSDKLRKTSGDKDAYSEETS